MKTKLSFLGRLNEDGTLSLEGLRNLLGLHFLLGKKLLIELEVFEPRRSDAQNRYYWGVCIPTIRKFLKDSEGVSYTSDELHCFNMVNVVGKKPEIKQVFGMETVVMTSKTTSQMNVKEFEEFREMLQAYWAEKGCVIPDPNQHNLTTDHYE